MTELIAVPYHLGERGAAVGAGPLRILETGIDQRLPARLTVIDLGEHSPWQQVNAALTVAVADARAAGRFPLVVAGNCNSCLGTLAALQSAGSTDSPGIVWFDAHGDFHTDETSISGSLEGKSLALATEQYVPEHRVVLAGARDLDRGEIDRVYDRLLYIPSANLRSQPLPEMRAVYIHLDIDVLDASISPGTNYQGPGGLTLAQLHEALAFTLSHYDVAALAITNYNPDHDPDNRTRDIIIEIIESVENLRKVPASR
jgi:arginase